LLLPLVESAPGEGAIQVLFLRVLHRLAEFDFALETAQGLEQSGVLAPAAAGVASLIAIDHDELGLARQWAQRALRADPMQIEALVTRASIALDEAEGSLACEFAERALTLHPQDGRAASVLGLARLMKFEFDGARQSFERALLTLPEHIGTWIALGWTCLMSRDLEGARHAFQSAMDLDRNFSESHGGLAVVEALSGQTESARTHIKIAQALDPRDLSSQYAQALLSGEAQHPDKFLRVATRALKVRGVPWPQSPETKH
jgi:Flp pilus assembly protein TadD